jgi:hypothetical protein
MNNTILGGNDFTLYQQGGKLMSGDFVINTNLDSESNSNSLQEGGTGTDSASASASSNILKNLAMPLYYFSQKGGKKGQKIHNYAESEPENAPVIDDNIFDKLLKMIEYKEGPDSSSDSKKVLKKRGTRKHIDNPKQKTGKKSRKFREKNN